MHFTGKIEIDFLVKTEHWGITQATNLAKKRSGYTLHCV